jgi:hypothetical protein
MSDTRFVKDEELLTEKPKLAGPIMQERAKGHKLLAVGHETYAEVSLFKGKVYVGIRRWFLADDGSWYRTKNGLNMKSDEMLNVLAMAEKIMAFIQTEEQAPYNGEV